MDTRATPALARRHRTPPRVGGSAPLTPRVRRAVTIVAFLLPAITVLGTFVFWPMLSALRLSFTDASGFGREAFVGLENYDRVFTDESILRAVGNTVQYSLIFTPAAVIFALAVALALNQSAPTAAGLLPHLVVPAVHRLVGGRVLRRQYLLDPQVGLLNYWCSSVRPADWQRPAGSRPRDADRGPRRPPGRASRST